MRKLKTIVNFTDKELKNKFIKEGLTVKEATKKAERKIDDIFETDDERASILLNLKYVELVKAPIILDIPQEEVKIQDKPKPKKKSGK